MKAEERIAPYAVQADLLVLLGEVCKTTSGGTPSRKKPDYFSGSIPWVKSGELPDGPVVEIEESISEEALRQSSAKLFPAGTLLMALYGATVGKLGILTKPAATNQAVCAIFPPPDLDTKFLFWFLRFKRSELIAQAVGGAQPNISQGIVRDLKIPLLPPDQQKRIVAEIEKQFSRLDEAVANLKRVKVNLKRYKAAVLKAAVEGRLVETEAELARREGRSFESGEELLNRILKERREKWSGRGKYKEPAAADTSNLSELPEGWVWAISDVIFEFVTSGSRGWAKYYSDSGSMFLRVGNLDHGTIDLDLSEIQHVLPPTNPEADRSRVKPGDLLISITAELGMAAIVPDNLGDAYINQHVAIARSTDSVNKNYIGWYFACEHAGKKQLESLRRGATKAGLGLDDIRSVYIALPPLSEQHRIVVEVDRRLSLICTTEAQVDANLRRAERLRQSVLARSFRRFPS